MSEGYMGGICTVHVDNSAKIGSRSIVEGFNDCPPRQEAIANSLLIAAAPDLLDACFQAMALHEDDEGITAVLRAAIAKATQP